MTKNRNGKKIRLKETQLLILGYLLVILVGSFLLCLPAASRDGEWTNYADALFTATSSTCVTGLVTVDTFLKWTGFGQVVILILIQIGGLGFMTVITTTLMVLGRKIGLYERKILMQSAGTMRLSGIVHLVRRITIGTAILKARALCCWRQGCVPSSDFGRDCIPPFSTPFRLSATRASTLWDATAPSARWLRFRAIGLCVSR